MEHVGLSTYFRRTAFGLILIVFGRAVYDNEKIKTIIYGGVLYFELQRFEKGQMVLVTGIPEQIHISYGRDACSIVVMWATRADVTGLVKYGTSADHQQLSSRSEVVQLPAREIGTIKYIHRAELENLTEGVRYFYKVADLDSVNATVLSTSGLYDFTVPHTELNGTHTLKFLVYGDLGVDEHPKLQYNPTYGELERQVAQDQFAAILHVGDIGYDLHAEKGWVGDFFLNKIQSFAAKVPYMICPGNHEYFFDVIHYRTWFSTPKSPWPIPKNKLWYSFDLGPVHFISYSTEVYINDFQRDVCTQFYWLLKDLTAANKNRVKTPWIIAIGHRPMYCSNLDADDCNRPLYRGWVKHGLEDLFYAQGVDLILHGHKHSYERLWPQYKGMVTSYSYINPRATIEVISGAAGSQEKISMMSKGERNKWSAFQLDNGSMFSFGKMEIFNRTHLDFKQISAVSGKIIDNFWIVQYKHGPFVHNIDCTGTGNHFSCFCPCPFFQVIYLLICGAVALLGILGLLYWCYQCCRKRLIPRVNFLKSYSRIHRSVRLLLCICKLRKKYTYI